MSGPVYSNFQERVVNAAEAVLERAGSVGPLDREWNDQTLVLKSGSKSMISFANGQRLDIQTME
jgi:hypothetical protein